ncbi:MAG TPA: hypothetical protein VH877_24985 [Polyangia bacterium]|jgi:hypothetical protein|nr:hypothetical protein [Polyangia bacterium]
MSAVHYTPIAPMPGSIEAALAQIADTVPRDVAPWRAGGNEALLPQTMGLEAFAASPVSVPAPDDVPVVYMASDDPAIETVEEVFERRDDKEPSAPTSPAARPELQDEPYVSAVILAAPVPANSYAIASPSPGAPPAMEESSSSPPARHSGALAETSAVASAAVLADTLVHASARQPKRRSWRWPLLDRMVIGLGGVMLLFVFARAAPLLMTFHGIALVLHEYFLSAGVLLLGASLLPLPQRGRGLVGAGVGIVGLLLTGPSLTGFGALHGLGVAVAFAILPAGLLLWVQSRGARLARMLVGGSVGLSVLLYFLPSDGVLPIVMAFRLFIEGADASLLSSLYLLFPLLLASLALTTLGRPQTRLGLVWAALVVFLAPSVTMAAGLTRGDQMLLHLGLALLGTGTVVSVGLLRVLSPAPSLLR